VPLTNDALEHKIDLNFQVAEEGHARLRRDYRSLETRLVAMEALRLTQDAHFDRLDQMLARPIEVSALRFTPAVVMAVISMCLTVAGGMWASTYGLRSDVRDILTKMAATADLERSNTKLQDERALTLTKTIETIDKKQELQRLKLEAITETVLRQQR
jgi:hypothetical protein